MQTKNAKTMEGIVIELEVNNHAGVMSHVAGLFSRRGFNLEGILCGSIGDGSKSRMYLLVRDDEKLEQIIKQLRKLYDVVSVSVRRDYDLALYSRIHEDNKGTKNFT
ncbi:MAG: acetolactate synthase small subunit [Candidatus Omnitrophica bacterium]|nr:acetolactate synthase small subunit [Candidatus Omnitrophota bacterium]